MKTNLNLNSCTIATGRYNFAACFSVINKMSFSLCNYISDLEFLKSEM